eukprot:XP_001703527.1 predicted protein [Chlamydomonas reinhardtii]
MHVCNMLQEANIKGFASSENLKSCIDALKAAEGDALDHELVEDLSFLVQQALGPSPSAGYASSGQLQKDTSAAAALCRLLQSVASSGRLRLHAPAANLTLGALRRWSDAAFDAAPVTAGGKDVGATDGSSAGAPAGAGDSQSGTPWAAVGGEGGTLGAPAPAAHNLQLEALGALAALLPEHLGGAMAQALSEHERAAQLAALQSLLVPVALQQHAGASVRAMAASTIASLVDGPAPRAILALLLGAHAGLLHAVGNEPSTLVLPGVLRALCVMIAATPYERLPPEVLPETVRVLRARWAQLCASAAATGGGGVLSLSAAGVAGGELAPIHAAYLACLAECLGGGSRYGHGVAGGGSSWRSSAQPQQRVPSGPPAPAPQAGGATPEDKAAQLSVKLVSEYLAALARHSFMVRSVGLTCLGEVSRALAGCLRDTVLSVRIAASWAVANLCDAHRRRLLETAAATAVAGLSDERAASHELASTSASPRPQASPRGKAAAASPQGSRHAGPAASTSAAAASSSRSAAALLEAHHYAQVGALCAAAITATQDTDKSSLTTGGMKVQWNACYAAHGLLRNGPLLPHPRVGARVAQLLLLLVMLVRESANFKIRTHAAAALAAMPTREGYGDVLADALLVLEAVQPLRAAMAAAASAGSSLDAAAPLPVDPFGLSSFGSGPGSAGRGASPRDAAGAWGLAGLLEGLSLQGSGLLDLRASPSPSMLSPAPSPRKAGPVVDETQRAAVAKLAALSAPLRGFEGLLQQFGPGSEAVLRDVQAAVARLPLPGAAGGL